MKSWGCNSLDDAAGGISAYCERLDAIARAGGRIKEVHAYTVARPAQEPFAAKLNAEELGAIAETIRQKTGLRVIAFD